MTRSSTMRQCSHVDICTRSYRRCKWRSIRDN